MGERQTETDTYLKMLFLLKPFSKSVVTKGASSIAAKLKVTLDKKNNQKTSPSIWFFPYRNTL